MENISIPQGVYQNPGGKKKKKRAFVFPNSPLHFSFFQMKSFSSNFWIWLVQFKNTHDALPYFKPNSKGLSQFSGPNKMLSSK